MNIAIILAAGQGARLKNNKGPKALQLINKDPIYLFSLKKFYNLNLINKIILAVPAENINQVQKKIRKMLDKVNVIGGGTTRSKTLDLSFKFIEKNIRPKMSDVIITHDSARIFVNEQIIKQNILVCKGNNFSTTVRRCNDTIFTIEKNKTKQLDRERILLIETPQASLFKNWKNKQLELNGTDLISCLKLDLKLKNVVYNKEISFKITFEEDLLIAKKIIDKKK